MTGLNFNKIYFIGIGGVHMSGLAELLHNNGHVVLGSDAKKSGATEKLSSLGIRVYIGHDKNNIDNSINLVVYTSAVKSNNPEMIKALELKLPIIDRAKLLGLVMRNYSYPICISGSHGKTTVTTMISEIFLNNGRNPTIMNGGICPSINSTMHDGSKNYFICESDEYYDAFLKFYPHIGIILNIDKDHTDYFDTFDKLWKSFEKFAKLINPEGALIINENIKNYKELTEDLNCQVITYGGETSDWQAKNRQFTKEGGSSFDVYSGTKNLGRTNLIIPGEHNIQNALAAFAASDFLGLSFNEINSALSTFTGAIRRFQKKGVFNGVTVIDDYAHHPSEIKATLSGIKNIEAGKIWCVFQPHTRSRTIELLAEFTESFDNADIIILLDIFTPSGREEGHIPIHTTDLEKNLRQRGKTAYYFSTFEGAARYIKENSSPGDMVITMGAGDVYLLGEMLIKD